MTTPANPADPTPASGTTVTIPVPPPPTPTAPTSTFTAEDIERARQQEKEKLYPELNQLKAKQAEQDQLLATFQAEREERERREQEAIAAAAAAAEEKRLAELSYGEKLAEFQAQQEQRFAEMQNQLALRDAMLEKERSFTELMQYRAARLEQEGDDIIPQLRDMVVGDTREQIDASISALKERSEAILTEMAAATGAARQSARGVGVTAPPVGPLDNNSGHESFSAEQLRDMDMGTYAQLRGRLLGAASQQQRDRGMFG